MKRFVLAILLCAACGPTTEVGLDADDSYQKACSVGDVCEPGCPNGAVHVDAEDAYDAQFASDQQRCTGIAQAPTDCVTAVACLSERCLLRGGE
jgi:hypothetical protein